MSPVDFPCRGSDYTPDLSPFTFRDRESLVPFRQPQNPISVYFFFLFRFSRVPGRIDPPLTVDTRWSRLMARGSSSTYRLISIFPFFRRYCVTSPFSFPIWRCPFDPARSVFCVQTPSILGSPLTLYLPRPWGTGALFY